MRPDIKYCGLTRPEDAAFAASVGAKYVGVIFAPSPRRLGAEDAAVVLGAAGPGPRRVGVFETAGLERILSVMTVATLDVAQVHAEESPSHVERLRRETGLEVWAVVRPRGGRIPTQMAELSSAADGVLLDAYSPLALGGTGVSLPWSAIAAQLQQRPRMLIIAGGLTASNVGQAIDSLQPDVVDVSSGVESAVGIKDREMMRAFAEAVRK
jgi:phosphoribosylanthranilate isomerase